MCKLSALGTFIHRNDPDHIAKIVSECMTLFGPQRCLFGSNFPIEKLWTGYSEVVAAYRRGLEPFGADAMRAVLHDTAAHVYRLE
jgi:predicted TIM-barrel fold metal-dependent hydrolase